MKNKTDIIYVSTLCSPGLFDNILKLSSDNPGIAIQKFNYLVASGLAMQESNIVHTISAPPITPALNKKRTWRLKPEVVDNINFNYILTVNLPFIRNLIVFLHAFIKILLWNFHSDINKKVVICDVSKKILVAGVYLGCRLRGLKMIALLTDMPGIDVLENTIKYRLNTMLARLFLTHYDGYILLTSPMNTLANPKKKTSIIMEGLVDSKTLIQVKDIDDPNFERILLYSGGIHEKYGTRMLIDAFMKLKEPNLRLDIYGSGPMEKEMPAASEKDPRIRYFGVVSNAEVVEKQLKATLLVNPRPSNEEYTKYSFPSKILEYMVSGTPVVTTHLPGIPDDYIPYVYFFQNESVDGIFQTLQNLLKKDHKELRAFGAEARQFVLSKKNNLEQGRKLTGFIQTVLGIEK